MRADIAQSCRIRSRSRRRSWAASRSRYEDLGVLRIPVRKPASTAIAPNGSETGPVRSRRRPRRGSRNRRDRTVRMTVAETSGCRAVRWHNNGHADREVDANLRGRRPGRDPRFHRCSSIPSKKTWELHVATWVPCAECTGFAPGHPTSQAFGRTTDPGPDGKSRPEHHRLRSEPDRRRHGRPAPSPPAPCAEMFRTSAKLLPRAGQLQRVRAPWFVAAISRGSVAAGISLARGLKSCRSVTPGGFAEVRRG